MNVTGPSQRDVVYGEAAGSPLLLDFAAPYPSPLVPPPAVVWIHGGGWEGGDKAEGWRPYLGPTLVDAGFFVASVNYRLSGQATFPAQLHDIKAALRWLRANAPALGFDAERVGVWGHSAGGHLAALLALTGDDPAWEGAGGSLGYPTSVRAVVAISAPANFLQPGGAMINDAASPVTRLFGGTVREHAEAMRRASPVNHARSDAPPFLIVHGERDEVVPFAQGQALQHALAGAGVAATFIPLPAADHGLAAPAPLPGHDEQWTAVGQRACDFFRRHLGDPVVPQ